MQYFKIYRDFLYHMNYTEAAIISIVSVFGRKCFLTNKQIAEELMLKSVTRLSSYINRLVKNGWLTVQIEKTKGNQRILELTKKSLDVINGTNTEAETETDPIIQNDHTIIQNDKTVLSKTIIGGIIQNDKTYYQKGEDLLSKKIIPIIQNDKTVLSKTITKDNNILDNKKDKKEIMSSAAGEKSAMPTAEPTHTPPPQTDFSSEKNHSAKQKKQNKNQRSQIPNVPDAETIAEEFIRSRPNLTRDVAVTEATKFRNYYLSHPNKCPENNFWNGLIGNWLMNDRDKLFAKNSLGESEQEPYYKRKYGQVDHAAMADWLFGK